MALQVQFQTKHEQAVALAHELFIQHRLINYSFGFDRAINRAGQCDFRARRITVSRHLVENCTLHEVEQIILHEIAHALVGKDAGHGRIWRAKAREIGYKFQPTSWHLMANSSARWVGHCPAGHQHFRMRKPNSLLSCRHCANGWSDEHVIEWESHGTD
ncbi:MAG: hypothetical protein RLY84_443 [Actinomycetota bacterium]